MVSFPTVYQRVVVHWRAIVLLLILGFVAFIVAPFDEFVPFMLILFALLLLFIASQIFWIGRILDLGERFIPGKPRRAGWVYRKARTAIDQHSAAADAEAALLSSSRRRFLERTAVLVSATPFVAAGYGLLYGRQNVEIVRQRIRLARLPKAFEGFHIAQLSDVHIGPFTTPDYIRRCVAITNGLEPDLIALTGDYISWDPEAQGEVVRVLAGLRAPHGVFGCMGNHEADVGIEESIT